MIGFQCGRYVLLDDTGNRIAEWDMRIDSYGYQELFRRLPAQFVAEILQYFSEE